jgi:eukaryotic-like serine/threonine-protein kinase
MPQTHSDRNLLFGILALQLDFINRDALVRAMQAWVLEKNKSLGQILLELQALSTEHCSLLETLVEQHLRVHDQQATKSLAALPSARILVDELKSLADSEVDASLQHLSTNLDSNDPHATRELAERGSSESSGRFRFLRPHARGGLGEVNVALDQELHREVAVKEIQARYADDYTSRSRFLQEAEITGGLEHPGVVPVYSLGVYADGRPYYAMRFIQGQSLKEAIDRFHAPHDQPLVYRSLELRKLLRRFTDVCNAMTYAHSRGVIHRDIKPSNIMLGSYGETLVVDWGLAKPLERVDKPHDLSPPHLTPQLAGDTAPTEMGAVLGTPAYMSPEQAAGRLDLLGPASDVYSLGATLYTLLVGQPPFQEKDRSELLRMVQQGTFPSPRALDKSIDPALEAICLKAMSHQPGDRYLSPRDLADDVEHWMADEPISARPDPWSATLRRWISRHRTPVAGLAAATLVAAVTLGVATYFLTQAKNKLDHANHDLDLKNGDLQLAKDDALAQKERAAESYRMARAGLESALSIKDDERLHSGKLEDIRKKLAQAGATFYEKYAGLHAAEPEFRFEQAMAYSKLAVDTVILGSRDEAIGHFEKSANLLKQLQEEFPDSLTYADELQQHYNDLGFYLANLKKYPQAEEYLLKARGIEKEMLAKQPSNDEFRYVAGMTLANLGKVYLETQRLPDSKKAVDESIQFFEAITPAVAKTGRTARWWSGLANAYTWRGYIYALTDKPQEAVDERSKGIAIWKELTRLNPNEARFLRDLAVGYFFLGMNFQFRKEWKKAEDNFLESRNLREQLVEKHPYVPEYKNELADTFYQLAWVYQQTQRLELSLTQYPEIVKIYEDLEREYPKEPNYKSRLAWVLSDFALAVEKEQKKDQWLDLASKSLRIRRNLVKAYPLVAEYKTDLCTSLAEMGNYYYWTMKLPDKALPFLEDSLGIEEEFHNAEPHNSEYASRLSDNYLNASYVYNALGRSGKVFEVRKKALALAQAVLGKDPTNLKYQDHVADCHRQMALCYEGRDENKEALEAFQTALAIKEKLRNPLAKETEWLTEFGALQLNYGRFLAQNQRVEEALTTLANAIDTLGEAKKVPSRDNKSGRIFVDALAARAFILSKYLAKHDDALKEFDKALKECTKEDSQWLGLWRACCLARKGAYREAVDAAAAVAKNGSTEPRLDYDAACVYALADNAVAQDAKLADAEKSKIRDEFALRAVELLEKAKTKKYFQTSTNAKQFHGNTDFESIKDRKEFKQFVEGIDGNN